MHRALSESQVLASLTTNPALYFKAATKGKVEKGFDADLVVLDGDPMTDVRNLAKVAYTIPVRAKSSITNREEVTIGLRTCDGPRRRMQTSFFSAQPRQQRRASGQVLSDPPDYRRAGRVMKRRFRALSILPRPERLYGPIRSQTANLGIQSRRLR
jgi:hypothetical protein